MMKMVILGNVDFLDVFMFLKDFFDKKLNSQVLFDENIGFIKIARISPFLLHSKPNQ